MISYPLSIINLFVSIGLLTLYYHRSHPSTSPASNAINSWNPPVRAGVTVTIFFLLSNIYLVIAPFIPPSGDQNVYESLPYYLHCVVGLGIFGVGAVYWLVWAKILPKIGGYRLERHVVHEEGVEWPRNEFVKIKNL